MVQARVRFPYPAPLLYSRAKFDVSDYVSALTGSNTVLTFFLILSCPRVAGFHKTRNTIGGA